MQPFTRTDELTGRLVSEQHGDGHAALFATQRLDDRRLTWGERDGRDDGNLDQCSSTATHVVRAGAGAHDLGVGQRGILRRTQPAVRS